MLEDRLWKCWKRKTSQIAATTFFDLVNHLLDTLDCQLRRARSASRSKPSPKAVAGRRKSAEAVDESETGSANFFWSLPTRSVVSATGGPVEGVWGNREVPPRFAAAREGSPKDLGCAPTIRIRQC